MAKNIALCSDGTGNTTIKGRGTNVFKLFEAVDVHGHRRSDGPAPQISFYDDGIGTERLKPIKLLTGALGIGLSRNVKQLYAALARAYDPGDSLFLFGFSRGAFTVRTLAGLILDCGIIDRNRGSNEVLLDLVDEAYEAYRRKYRSDLSRWLRGPATRESAERFRREHAVKHPQHAPDGRVRIRFIGVWDTVDAVGLPVAHVADFINKFVCRYKFPDLQLGRRVERACHAIAIDDERHTFHPVMWDEHDEEDGRIEQVWFAGVHSNVGGGYPKQGISLVPLAWMMKRAEAAGLRFVTDDRDFYWGHQNVHDKLYDSRAGLAFYYRYKPRDIAETCERHGVTPRLHLSAIERILQGTEGYAPGNIPRDHVIVATEPEPGDPDSGSVTQAIAAALGSDRSPLDRVRGWVLARRAAHYAALALSLLVVVLALALRARESGLWNVLRELASWQGLYAVAVTAVTKLWPLVATLIVVLGFGEAARRRMSRVFSEFWHGVVARLR